MRSQLSFKLALGSAALAGLALLAPTASAVTPTKVTPAAVVAPATIPQCTPDNCDSLIEYYSDATYTVRVGEYEDGPCGQLDNGVHTEYYKVFRRYC
ncbi:MAG: hypothetical protein ABI140_17565 [Jatrophihabitantaceae bacterium]